MAAGGGTYNNGFNVVDPDVKPLNPFRGLDAFHQMQYRGPGGQQRFNADASKMGDAMQGVAGKMAGLPWVGGFFDQFKKKSGGNSYGDPTSDDAIDAVNDSEAFHNVGGEYEEFGNDTFDSEDPSSYNARFMEPDEVYERSPLFMGPIKARADGGPINPNQPYLVGENGPEVVIPKQAGTVIPNPATAYQASSDDTSYHPERPWRILSIPLSPRSRYYNDAMLTEPRTFSMDEYNSRPENPRGVFKDNPKSVVEAIAQQAQMEADIAGIAEKRRPDLAASNPLNPYVDYLKNLFIGRSLMKGL